MAKQPKFSSDRLASELLTSGDATSSKVDFVLSRISALASLHQRPMDKVSPYSLSDVAEQLILHGFLRNRLVHQASAPDGVERLGVRFVGMQVRLALRLTGGGRELSCTYLSGSVKLPQLTTADSVAEFILDLDNTVSIWLNKWEQILFDGWQNARQMEKASVGIENFVSDKVKKAGLRHTLTMLTNYAEISIIVAQGIKLTAKVPHIKYERSIENLIDQAASLNLALCSVPDDIRVSI